MSVGSRLCRHWRGLGVTAVVVVVAGALVAALLPGVVLRQLEDGHLEAADYWSRAPSILSAGLGFDGIIGLPSLDEKTVRDAGGSWYGGLVCGDGQKPTDGQRTSASLEGSTGSAFRIADGATVDHDDGLPVVFSWPVRTDTVDPRSFRFTLNTGATVFPDAAGMLPNWERDERNVVVVFGRLGNRTPPGRPGAVFPVRLDVVGAARSLVLAGPDGDRSAVGLSWTTEDDGYSRGPTLVGAKLNRVGTPRGEGGVHLLGGAYLPNDEVSLYGSAARYRLRMLTTGGFSPDGVTGVRPDEYERFFRLRGTGPDGRTVELTRTGVDYQLAHGRVRVLGLSDLGRAAGGGVRYDDCYAEDRDNYLDVVLDGDEGGVRDLTDLEIPSTAGGYAPLYNPGGPGPEPTAGVRYTSPSPPHVQPIVLALDDPMRVDR